MLNKRRRLAE